MKASWSNGITFNEAMGAGSSLRRFVGKAKAIDKIIDGPFGPISGGVANWDEAVAEAAQDALAQSGLAMDAIAGVPSDGARNHADGFVRVTITVAP